LISVIGTSAKWITCVESQKQAWNTTKTASAHHDVLNVFCTSYLHYRFGDLPSSGKRRKGDAGAFAFSCRVLQSLSRCLRNRLL
jgi:hypothetical protein